MRNEEMNYKTQTQVEAVTGDVKAMREAQIDSELSDADSREQRLPLTAHECRLLSKLRPVTTALHSAEGAPRACHRGTRKAVLRHVKAWFQDSSSSPILWLSGVAGTGKTAIAQSICEMLEAHLAASFLFSRELAERRSESSVLPTIAYQIAYSHPILRREICDMLSEDPDFASKSVQVQAQELLTTALGSDLTSGFPVTLLIFDALDERDKKDNREGGNFIPLLICFLKTYPSRFKVVITSRPEASIHQMLQNGNSQIDFFVLHEMDRKVVQTDIETYLRHELAQIAEKQRLEGHWSADIREKQVKQLAELADRLFIFAATIVKALSTSHLPALMIKSLLENTARSNQSLRAPLDKIYYQIIQGVIPTTVSGKEAQELAEAFQRIIGAIVTLGQPLSFVPLGKLLNVDEDKLQAIIKPLYSVLEIDYSHQRPIQFFHLSFLDFLTDRERCIDPRFRILRHESHDMLAIYCLRIMNEQLKRNICAVEDPSLLNSEVEDLDGRCKRYISAELRYACLYWSTHLENTEYVIEKLVSRLKTFTSQMLLQWLELLSLIEQVQSALIGLPKVTEQHKSIILSGSKQSYKERFISSISIKHSTRTRWLEGGKEPQELAILSQQLADAVNLLNDVYRIAQAFFRPISESSLQVYNSALTFMPQYALSSQLEVVYPRQVNMTSKRLSNWSQELRVMDGHTGPVWQVVVSPNRLLLASRSNDKTIRLWDLDSGIQLTRIESKSCYLAFSPDSLRLLSLAAESDHLDTWDVFSGNTTSRFSLHLSGKGTSLLKHSTCQAISPTGSHVVIGLGSGELYLFAMNGVATQLQ